MSANIYTYMTLFLSISISTLHGQSAINCTSTGCQYQTITSNKISCIGDDSCQGASLTSGNIRNGYIDCSGSESCSGRSVNKTQYPSTITAASNVYCSGKNACYNSGEINGKNVYCTGKGGCAQYSTLPSSEVVAVKNVYCYGSGACHTRPLQIGAKAVCGGEYGCLRSDISGGNVVNCDGQGGCQSASLSPRRLACCAGRSGCAFSEIANTNEVRAYGAMALFGATVTNVESIKGYGQESLISSRIDSDSLSTMTVQLFGDSSGTDTNIICQSGSECLVSCKGNGCNGLTYYCLSGAVCNIMPAGCLSDNSVSDVNGVICPTFTDTLTSSNLEGIRTSKMDEDEDENENVKASEIKMDSNTDCESKRQCADRNIGSYYTFCEGEEACLGTTFTSHGIWCEGSRSCAESIVQAKNAEDNLQCIGYSSCSNSRILATSLDGSAFQCRGSKSCAGSNLKVDTSYCQGKLSCSKATIEIRKDSGIIISGYFGATRSSIYYAANIVLSGYKALYLGSIDSVDTDSLIITTYGHLAGDGASIICRNSSICTLNCRTSGCSNLDYICENGAICNIDPVQCDGSRNKYQGIDCPIRTTTTSSIFTDQYMIKKYENNKDIYDTFDQYLDDIMDNEEFDYDDIEDMMEEMIFTENIDIMEKNKMNMNDNMYINIVVFIVCIGIVAFMAYLRYIFNSGNKGAEYVAI